MIWRDEIRGEEWGFAFVALVQLGDDIRGGGGVGCTSWRSLVTGRERQKQVQRTEEEGRLNELD